MASQYKESAKWLRIGPIEAEPEFRANLVNVIPALRTFLRMLSRSRELAEDLTQDVLAKAWRARGTFEPGSNFKAWMFTIGRNEFLSHCRRAWRQTIVDPVSLELIPAAPDKQNWATELSDMARALSCLPETQREAVLLVGAGGFSYEEAATISRISLGTLKSRVFRGRHALQTMMDDDQIPPAHTRTGSKDAMTEILAEVTRLSPISVPRIVHKSGVRLRETAASGASA